MFAESSSSVRVAPWEKVFASLFTSLVEEAADISINKSRDSKGPWKCPYSIGIDAPPKKKQAENKSVQIHYVTQSKPIYAYSNRQLSTAPKKLKSLCYTCNSTCIVLPPSRSWFFFSQ